MHTSTGVECAAQDGGGVAVAEEVRPRGSKLPRSYVSDAVKPGHTFMLFANPRGVMGSLTTDHVDPTTTIPYSKGTRAAIRRVGEQPDLAKNPH